MDGSYLIIPEFECLPESIHNPAFRFFRSFSYLYPCHHPYTQLQTNSVATGYQITHGIHYIAALVQLCHTRLIGPGEVERI